MKIKDIIQNTSLPVVVLCLAMEEKVAKNGSPYVTLTLTDGETQIAANCWNTQKESFPYKEKELFIADIAARTYNGSIAYTVNAVQSAPEGSKTSDYVRKAPIDEELTFFEILSVLDGISYQPLRELATSLLAKNKEDFISWNGAVKMHHDMYAGLLYHTYRMLQGAMALSEIYKTVNTDLLYAGVILHDIGKLKEMNSELGVAEFTPDGELMGHILLGIQMIQEEAYTMIDPPSEECMRQLIHIIASHHGLLEYGAISTPSTLEAYLVSQLDMMDSRVIVYEEALKETEPGQCSDKKMQLNKAAVYHPDTI